MKNFLQPEIYFCKINIQQLSSKYFWILTHLFAIYSVDMATSKYYKFGYASMCGNM